MTETEIQGVLHRIVGRITERFRPDKIILFGSYARGAQTADSDADLLIVMNVPGSKRRASVEIDLLLVGIPIPTDIIAVTPEDVEGTGITWETSFAKHFARARCSMLARPEIFHEACIRVEKVLDLRQIPDDLGLTGGARVET